MWVCFIANPGSISTSISSSKLLIRYFVALKTILFFVYVSNFHKTAMLSHNLTINVSLFMCRHKWTTSQSVYEYNVYSKNHHVQEKIIMNLGFPKHIDCVLNLNNNIYRKVYEPESVLKRKSIQSFKSIRVLYWNPKLDPKCWSADMSLVNRGPASYSGRSGSP